MAYTFNEDVFVVDCWTDTKEKENILKQLLLKLKVYGCPIVLCGHYPTNPEIITAPARVRANSVNIFPTIP